MIKVEPETRQYSSLLNAVQTITEVLHFEGAFITYSEASKENANRHLSDSQTFKRSHSDPLVSSKRRCTLYFLRHNGLITLAAKFRELSPVMVEPTLNLVQSLIEDICAVDLEIGSDQDLILGVTAFLQSMMTSSIMSKASECKFCELMFSMASIMKIHSGLLDCWFYTIEKVAGAPSRSLPTNASKGKRSKSMEQVIIENGYHREFPLFCLLLNYVYHGGKSGEFSRAGLLYLIEVASESQVLVKWVLNSDLGVLMASGLCALYSQLSRSIQNPSSKEVPQFVQGIGQKDLQVFLSYLLFWQDMLKFAQKSTSLTQNLVYHFDVLFVRQLLYHSVVESTDSTGGYSDSLIGVLTNILDELDHNLLSQAVVCYFMGYPIVHQQYDSAVKESAPVLTLNDIICSTLAVGDTRKRTQALKLSSILIYKFYPYTMDTLILTKRCTEKDMNKGYLKNLNIVQCVCTRALDGIISPENLRSAVACYKRDIESMVERTTFPAPPLKKRLLAEELERVEAAEELLKSGYPQGVLRLHELEIIDFRDQKSQPTDNSMSTMQDSMLSQIFGVRLPGFFRNSVSENLMLTLVITELGVCGWLKFHGWVTLALLKQIQLLKVEYMDLRSKIDDFDALLEAAKTSMDVRYSYGDEDSDDHKAREASFKSGGGGGGGPLNSRGNEMECSTGTHEEVNAFGKRKSSFGDWISSPLRARDFVSRQFSIFSLSSTRSVMLNYNDQDEFTSEGPEQEQDRGQEQEQDHEPVMNSILNEVQNTEYGAELLLHSKKNGGDDNKSHEEGSDADSATNLRQQRLNERLEKEEVEVISDAPKVKLLQVCTNALIFQDFVCEIKALYHIRFWLFENA